MIRKECVMRKAGVSQYQLSWGLRKICSGGFDVEWAGKVYDLTILTAIPPGDKFTSIIREKNKENANAGLKCIDEYSLVTCVKEVQIRNRLSIHASTAARLCRYYPILDAEVYLEYGNHQASIGDLMRLLLLSPGEGANVKIIAYGPEAFKAVEMISHEIENRFGESE